LFAAIAVAPAVRAQKEPSNQVLLGGLMTSSGIAQIGWQSHFADSRRGN
jgi:hypothetical protein